MYISAQEKKWHHARKLLDRAHKSSDVTMRDRLCDSVEEIFEQIGYPDWWSYLERVRWDTAVMVNMAKDPWS